PRHPPGHRRRSDPDVDSDRRGDVRAIRAGPAGPHWPAPLAGCGPSSPPAPHRLGGVDLSQPDTDGPRAAVAHDGTRRVDPRAAGGDSEGRAVVTIPSTRPAPEGPRCGAAPRIQPGV